jgi:hypothetical protein
MEYLGVVFSLLITLVSVCGAGLVTLVAVAVPVAILWQMMKAGDATKKLLAEGEPARAKVLELHQTGMMINDNPQVRMVVDVTREGGVPYRAQIVSVIDFLAIPRVQPGCDLRVRVDRANPQNLAVEAYGA